MQGPTRFRQLLMWGLLACLSLAQAASTTAARDVHAAAPRDVHTDAASNVEANGLIATTNGAASQISENATRPLAAPIKPPENVVQIPGQLPFLGAGGYFDRVPGRYFQRRCFVGNDQERLSLKSLTCDDEQRGLKGRRKLSQ